MEMEIREFNQYRDYNKVSDWWKHYSFHPMPIHALPKTGVIVNDICAGWLYKTDSSFSLIEWVVSDPNSDKEERGKALDALFETLIKEAKTSGYGIIFSTTPNVALTERYIKHGLIETDTGCSHFIRRIDENFK